MEKTNAWKSLAIYWLASFLIALILMAYQSRGPDEMIANTLVVWFIPAIIAFVLRNQNTVRRRYLGPTVWLILIVALMLIGRGVIRI